MQPKRVKTLSFDQVLAEANRRMQEEDARYNAMTPAQREEYLAQKARDHAEMEKALAELGRDPGFAIIQLGQKP